MTGISGAAAARAADAMLRTLGGTEVTLLFAAAGLPAGGASELGLVDPGVEQATIAPVVVRELTTENNGPRRRIELLAGYSALAEQVSQRSVATADVLFETALDWCIGEKCFISRDLWWSGWGEWPICTGGGDELEEGEGKRSDCRS